MSTKFNRRHALALGGGVAALGVLGIGATATAEDTTDTAGEWLRLPVITANIGRKHLAKREAAIRAVRNGDPGHRPLVGFQEICEGDEGEKDMIRHYFNAHYAVPFLGDAKSYRVPIAVPTHWKVVSTRKTFVHKGISPHVTPPRWINEAVIRHTEYSDVEFAFINTHYIANAYNGDKKPALKKKWDHHKELHKERVLAHHKAGRPVIWTADTNHHGYRTATGWDAEHRVLTSGIDRIDWMPGNGDVQLEFRGKSSVDMHVDGHNAQVAVFRIRKA